MLSLQARACCLQLEATLYLCPRSPPRSVPGPSYMSWMNSGMFLRSWQNFSGPKSPHPWKQQQELIFGGVFKARENKLTLQKLSFSRYRTFYVNRDSLYKALSISTNLVPRTFHRREPWDGRPTLGGEKPWDRQEVSVKYFDWLHLVNRRDSGERMAQSVSARPWRKRSWVRFPDLTSLFRLLSVLYSLRTVPTIVIVHTFCASWDTRISYRWCLLIQGYFCAV